MSHYCFGIDVGGTTVKCGLFTVKGEILDKWEIPTRIQEEGKYILPDIAKSVLAKLEEKEIAREDVAGIGIGVPGPVNEDGDVEVAVNLHWKNVHLSRQMEELTGIHTRGANDANIAALGEMWKGGGVGCKNLVLITLGTGVGGGVIVNEKILVGTHGAAGEIGHAHVEDDFTQPCNCGNCGCLEQFAAAGGIVRLAREALAASQDPSLMREGELSAKTVFDAVKARDPLALQVADRFGWYLGKTLAVVACVTDPERIVIGGGVSKAGPVLLEPVRKYFRKYAFQSHKDCTFALATLGNDAGIYGGARLVL